MIKNHWKNASRRMCHPVSSIFLGPDPSLGTVSGPVLDRSYSKNILDASIWVIQNRSKKCPLEIKSPRLLPIKINENQWFWRILICDCSKSWSLFDTPTTSKCNLNGSKQILWILRSLVSRLESRWVLRLESCQNVLAGFHSTADMSIFRSPQARTSTDLQGAFLDLFWITQMFVPSMFLL